MYESDSEDDLRTIRALPLWQAFLAAVIAPIIIALVFAILGAQKNALLLQLEMILVAIAFCLTGILGRSKLLGLLSIFAAPISWVVLFFLSSFTNGWFVNPYGLLSELAGPLTSIAKSGLIPPEYTAMVDLIIQIAIIADLIIVEFLALFLGFFVSALATGIWTKKGELSIFSVIMKPIAAIFVILLLITVPLVYHEVANFADGGISLVAGGAEFMGVFGADLGLGGGGAQASGLPIDLSDPEVIENLTKACERAATWFKRSAYKFDHVQGNFYTAVLLGILPEEMGGMNTEKLPLLLDISEILATVSSELPSLLQGYNSLVDGFNRTFSVLATTDIGGGFGGSAQATYNPEFNTGLGNISTAIGHFGDSKEGVLNALGTAKSIVTEVIIDETGDLGFVVDIVDQADAGYGIILEVATGAIDFLNATYKTTLAIEELGDSDFVEAHSWLADASIDLTDANTTLQAINTSELGGNDAVLPFWGTVEIITDMTELLAYFSRAAANGTECYTKIESVLNTIDTIQFNGSDLDSINAALAPLSANVSEASNIFSGPNGAEDNIGNATSLSTEFSTKSYGDIIDGSLKPMLTELSNMLDQFSTNVTEIGHLLNGLEGTVNAVDSFTKGFENFNNSYTQAYTGAPNASVFLANLFSDPRFNQSEVLMGYAIANASDAHAEIGLTTVISDDVKSTWQNRVHNPAPGPGVELDPAGGSIAGLAQGVVDAIGLLKSVATLNEAEENQELIQDFFESMDEINLTDVFTGNGV